MTDDPNPRARLYGLLAHLLLDELDRPLAAYLRELPGLAEHIPPDAQLDDWLADMRAEHLRLFGLNIYPYESIFRDRELMLNSAATQRVTALYQACGFMPAERLAAAAPDHLGLELAIMGELAEQAAHNPVALTCRGTLLHDHLAAWLPACTEAIGRAARAPLHHALAEIAVELVLGELKEVRSSHPHPPAWSADSHLQEQPLTLSPAWETSEAQRAGWPGGEGDSEDLDLRQIVGCLLTPDEIGVFICRTDIMGMGRALGLPTPVAERKHMLLSLFEAAGRFEQAPGLLGALGERLRAADATYARLAAMHPAWEPYGLVWRGRVANGLGLLERLARDLQRIEDRR